MLSKWARWRCDTSNKRFSICWESICGEMLSKMSGSNNSGALRKTFPVFTRAFQYSHKRFHCWFAPYSALLELYNGVSLCCERVVGTSWCWAETNFVAWFFEAVFVGISYPHTLLIWVKGARLHCQSPIPVIAIHCLESLRCIHHCQNPEQSIEMVVITDDRFGSTIVLAK